MSLKRILGSSQLSAKEKRYASNVEKALQHFDTVEEWADYISFLSKLSKALSSKPDEQEWIPHEAKVAEFLSQCLVPKLPSGVHRKALEVYQQIFSSININERIFIWLPGILPLMSFASISVKPQLFEFYNTHIVSLSCTSLRTSVKPLLLSILPGLDDETSEFCDDSINLLEKLRTNLNDEQLFWQAVFLCVITCNDRRMGALNWMLKKLPSFNDNYSLLVKAVCCGLQDSNLLVQRGFFDLLSTKIPCQDVPEKERETLLYSAASCVLRRDMSLNRRLWVWLLGPQNEASYFSENALKPLSSCMFKLLRGEYNSLPRNEQIIRCVKIANACLDRWEVGQYVVLEIFIPIVEAAHSVNCDDVNHTVGSFINSVDAYTIWGSMMNVLKVGNVALFSFFMDTFYLEDEEMAPHLQMMLFVLLDIPGTEALCDKIADLIPPRCLDGDTEEIDVDALYRDKLPLVPIPRVLIAKTKNLALLAKLLDKSSVPWDPRPIIESLPSITDYSALSNLYLHIFKNCRIEYKMKATKSVVENLWNMLIKSFWLRDDIAEMFGKLELAVETHHIEAGLSHLVLAHPDDQQIVAGFGALWNTNNRDMLRKPLFLLLDNPDRICFFEWVKQVLGSPDGSALVQMILSPMASPLDDSALQYYMETFTRLFTIDPLNVKAALKNDPSSIVDPLNTFFTGASINQTCFARCLKVLELVADESTSEHFLLILSGKVSSSPPVTALCLSTMCHLLERAPNFDTKTLSDLIVQGVSACNELSVLCKWLSMMLKIFTKDSIFLCLGSFTKCVLEKARFFFDQLSLPEPVTDSDQCLVKLLDCLESIVITAANYLTASIRSKNHETTSDQSFFGNMIQGVFQVETQQDRDEQEVAKASLLQCFKESCLLSFQVWSWSDSKTKIIANNQSKTLVHVATRLKFCTKRLLESVYSREPLIVIDVVALSSEQRSFKFLHILEKNNPTDTIKLLLRKTHPAFVNSYLRSLSSDTIEDIYPEMVGYWRDVNQKSFYDEILTGYVIVYEKKRFTNRKLEKEVADLFVKMVNSCISLEQVNTLESILPQVHLLVEGEKLTAILNNVVAHCLSPHWPDKEVISLANCVGSIVNERELSVKAWKSFIEGILNDGLFFQQFSQENLNLVKCYFQLEKSAKITDFLTKLTTAGGSIFSWTDTEAANLLYKKICLLLVVSPKNTFLNQLSELFTKVTECLETAKPAHLLLLRCMIFSFDEQHLNNLGNFWILVYNHLRKHLFLFHQILTTQQDVADHSFILGICKLLDTLIVLKPVDFQMCEWLFITECRDANEKSLSALVDQISELRDFGESVDDARCTEIRFRSTNTSCVVKRIPLLIDFHSLESLQSLKVWFDCLSLYNYEVLSMYCVEIYGVEASQGIDFERIGRDNVMDLYVETGVLEDAEKS